MRLSKVKPFRRWDMERWFCTDPLLTKTDRAVARQILAQMDDTFEPRLVSLKSQAFIGGRVSCWRESVNRSLRKLVSLGYFVKTWTTVQRKTAQGWKGVTRVLVSLGPVAQRVVTERKAVSAAQAHGVTSHHPSRALPAEKGTVSGSVIANSADRTAERAVAEQKNRRKALGQWPILATTRPVLAENLPSAVPVSEFTDFEAYRARLEALDAQLLAKRKQPRRTGR